MLRIGQGFDVHCLVAGSHLVLGGVNIPFDKAFAAHSDGDVLIHAIIDALLGAAALGDIGKFFPDNDIAYAGIDSRVLLRKTMFKLRTEYGYQVNNVDSTIIIEQPKLREYIDDMRYNIACDLEVSIDQVNVKAKTNEKLGYLGQGDAAAAEAVVLLIK